MANDQYDAVVVGSGIAGGWAAKELTEQRAFVRGIRALERACMTMHGVGFMSAAPAQRLALTLLGYFTSEAGSTLAMRYTEMPGRFDPCVPYAPGDRASAPHA